MPETMLGAKLKKLRKEKKITQEKLSGQLDLSPRYIGKIEAGIIKPSMETYRKLADFFQVPVEYLVSESEEANSLATVPIRNKKLLQYFMEVDQMDMKDQELISGVIDAVIMRNRMKAVLNGKK
ncbi:MAG: helix-turn-helix transcriptional regulator [Firmicutes bacterium]|nr:helix-turn-helix transcriptional regulator [Bacillota bacterium]